MRKKTQDRIDWAGVGCRIRELRGMRTNQKEFAQKIGISQGQLSRYEQGRSEVSADVLLRLAKQSGRTIEWFLTGRDTV